MGESETVVGRVAGLWRYPVKAMAAERLDAADVGWHGVAGDRRWAFVRPGLERSGFPWLTIRERSDLWRYEPLHRDPDRPDRSGVTVRTPAGATFDVLDRALHAELGAGVTVMKQDRGVFDSAPLSLITTQTVAALGAALGRELDPGRFRPNLVVSTGDEAAFAEDGWVGATLRVGTVRMRVDRRDRRCVVVDVDPATSERDPGVLRAIARERASCLGVYATPVTPGRAQVGDPVVLEG